MRVSSYDKHAPTPEVGSRWVWDAKRSGETVEVTEVKWNGEEWWVRTQLVHQAPSLSVTSRGWKIANFPAEPIGSEHWNDLGLFYESCKPTRPVGYGKPHD